MNQLKGFQPIGGMKRPSWDPRKFSFSKKFGATAGALPIDDFDVWTPLMTWDQGTNELCTDYGSIGAAEPQFNTVLDIAFQRAAHNKVAGTPGYIGPADPKQAALAIMKVGALPHADAPYSIDGDPAQFADLSKYPSELILEAGSRKEFSLYQCDGQDDLFDSIRDAMIRGRAQGFATIPMVGTKWRSTWLNSPGGLITSDNPNEAYGEHEFVIVGQKTVQGRLCLKAHLSSGTSYGDGGFFYFPREVVNNFIFAQAFGPGDPNDYKAQLWTAFQRLYNWLYTTFLSHPASPAAAPDPAPPAVNSAPTTVSPAYLWDTVQNARTSIKRICLEEGLDAYMLKGHPMTDVLVACIAVESYFNPQAIHINRDVKGNVSSTDYGIVQVNDYWHIGPGKDFPSVAYVLANPEACVRWMARMFKEGKPDLWVSYAQGLYTRYL